MAKKSPKKSKVVRTSSKVTGESKLFAFIAVLLSILGFLIVFLARREDSYAMYYAKQSLVIAIFSILVQVVGHLVPIVGWFIVLPAGGVLCVVFLIHALLNSISGDKKPTWLIGKYAESIDL